jgi:hypothetical protein
MRSFFTRQGCGVKPGHLYPLPKGGVQVSVQNLCQPAPPFAGKLVGQKAGFPAHIGGYHQGLASRSGAGIQDEPFRREPEGLGRQDGRPIKKIGRSEEGGASSGIGDGPGVFQEALPQRFPSGSETSAVVGFKGFVYKRHVR